jgi:phosphohistidine phosphatase
MAAARVTKRPEETVKTILLLRHGKSDWSAGKGEDHDRPLNERGKSAAAAMGKLLARLDQIPDRVLTSPALRAHDTARRAAKAGGWPCPLAVVPEFYASEPSTVLARVRQESDDAASLLLVGHEPTWSGMAELLIGGGSLRFPTAGLARIDLDASAWRAVDAGRGALVWFLIPRLVQSLEA